MKRILMIGIAVVVVVTTGACGDSEPSKRSSNNLGVNNANNVAPNNANNRVNNVAVNNTATNNTSTNNVSTNNTTTNNGSTNNTNGTNNGGTGDARLVIDINHAIKPYGSEVQQIQICPPLTIPESTIQQRIGRCTLHTGYDTEKSAADAGPIDVTVAGLTYTFERNGEYCYPSPVDSFEGFWESDSTIEFEGMGGSDLGAFTYGVSAPQREFLRGDYPFLEWDSDGFDSVVLETGDANSVAYCILPDDGDFEVPQAIRDQIPNPVWALALIRDETQQVDGGEITIRTRFTIEGD